MSSPRIGALTQSLILLLNITFICMSLPKNIVFKEVIGILYNFTKERSEFLCEESTYQIESKPTYNERNYGSNSIEISSNTRVAGTFQKY